MAELDPSLGPSPRSRRRRWTRWILGALVIGAALVFLLVAALPALLSSDTVRNRLEGEATRALGRPVQVDTLQLAWSGAFLLGGVRVADDPAFATDPLLTLDQLAIQVDPAGLLQQRATLSLRLTGLDLNVVRDPGGRTNLEVLLEQLGPPPPSAPRKSEEEAAAPREPTAGLTLPFREVDLTVRVERVNLRVDDRSQGRKAALRNISLDLDVHPPEYPIAAELRAGLWVDGTSLGPVRLTAGVEHLLGAGGVLDPGAARLTAEAEVPGGRLSAQGGLRVEAEPGAEAAAGLTAALALELGEVWAAARPFLPTELAASEVRGKLTLDLQGRGDPAQEVAFTLGLTGDGLRAGGAVVDGRQVGPVDLRMEHRGRYQAARGTLEIEDGRIGIQRGTHLAWRGQLEHLDGPAPRADLEVGPITLDLAELHRLARPWLPEDPALAWSGSEPPRLRLDRLSVTGPVAADGPDDQVVEFHNLVLAVPGAAAASAGTAVEIRGLRLQLDQVSTRLSGGSPGSLSVEGSLGLAALDLGGAQPVRLRDLSLSSLVLAAQALRPATAGKLPFAGSFELSQELAVGRVSAGPETSVDDLRQHLAARADVSEQGRLQVHLAEFGIRAARVTHDSGAAESPSVQLRPGASDGNLPGFALALADLRLAAPDTLEPDTFRLGSASVALSSVEAETGGSRITLGAATLRAEELQADLARGFPQNLAVGLNAAIEGLRLEGPNPVQMARLELPNLSVTARGLTPAAGSLFGVAGTFHLEQSLRGEGVQVPGAAVGNLHQDLALSGTLDAGGSARIQVPTLAVTLDEARVETPDGTVTLPLALRMRLDDLVLRGTAPEAVDLHGLSLHLGAGPLLTLTVDADTEGLGARALRTSGTLMVDAGAWSRALPAAYRAGGTFAGTAGLEWSLAGRLPSPDELEALQTGPPESWAAPRPLPFLEALELQARLTGVGADLPLGAGDRLTVGGIFTAPAMRVSVGSGGGSATVSSPLEVRWIEAAPGLPALEDPLRLRLSLQGSLGEDGTLALDQALAVQPLGVEQEARLTVHGVRRFLARGLGAPPALWLNLVSAEAEASLRVDGSPDLPSVAPGAGVRVQGPLRASVGANLARGEEAAAWLHLEATDAALALADQISLEGVDGSIRLDKRVRLGVLRGEAASASAPGFLSEEVLAEAGGSGGGRSQPPAQLTGAAAQGGGLRVARARVAGQPLPLHLDGLQLELGMPAGLPSVERLQLELLGGTLLSSLAFVPTTPGYALDGGLAFTGLSTDRLVPGAVGSAPEEAEVSGQLGFRVPLVTEFSQLLSDLELQFRLTQVGPHTLGRALYALDPGESNEAILEQRRLVRHGRPLWAAAEVRNGNLSLAGEVELLGAAVSLPKVERVPVAGLPGMLGLEPPAEPVAALVHLLDLLAADHLEIHPDGEFRLYTQPKKGTP